MQAFHQSNIPANMQGRLPSPLYIMLVLLAFVGVCVGLIVLGIAGDMP